MHVCSMEEGMMMRLNVTNALSYFFPSHLFHLGWRCCRGSCMKVWQNLVSCADTTTESLCDSDEGEANKSNTGNLKQSFSDHCISANLYITAKRYMDFEQLPTGWRGFFLVWFWCGSSDFNVLAFQCHQRHEAQPSLSRNLNLEDFMWTWETIRETTSEPLYPASSSSYMQLPA